MSDVDLNLKALVNTLKRIEAKLENQGNTLKRIEAKLENQGNTRKRIEDKLENQSNAQNRIVDRLENQSNAQNRIETKLEKTQLAIKKTNISEAKFKQVMLTKVLQLQKEIKEEKIMINPLTMTLLAIPKVVQKD